MSTCRKVGKKINQIFLNLIDIVVVLAWPMLYGLEYSLYT